MSEVQISRKLVPETNGDPDTLVEESTEVLLIESDPRWQVSIEHTGSERLIQISCESRDEAVALLDRIEAAFEARILRIRIDPGHLISLKAFRQAWISEPEVPTQPLQ